MVSVASNTLQIKASYDLSRDRRLFHPASRPSPLDNRQLQLGSETGMKKKIYHALCRSQHAVVSLGVAHEQDWQCPPSRTHTYFVSKARGHTLN